VPDIVSGFLKCDFAVTMADVMSDVVVCFFQDTDAAFAKLQLRMSLYDSFLRQFFGQTWIGPAADFKPGSKLAYNQV